MAEAQWVIVGVGWVLIIVGWQTKIGMLVYFGGVLCALSIGISIGAGRYEWVQR